MMDLMARYTSWYLNVTRLLQDHEPWHDYACIKNEVIPMETPNATMVDSRLYLMHGFLLGKSTVPRHMQEQAFDGHKYLLSNKHSYLRIGPTYPDPIECCLHA